jgi:hypothetical protein
MLVISALGRLRKEENKFKASMGSIVRPCFKKNQANKQTRRYMACYTFMGQ